MIPYVYLIDQAQANSLRLAASCERAADALVRFDERLARCDPPLAEGCRARADLFDAQAMIHLEGRLAPLEDLVLHEAGMDSHTPTPGIQRAVAFLGARRTLARRNPASALSSAGVYSFLGLVTPQSQAPRAPAFAALRPPWASPPDDDDDGFAPDDADDEPGPDHADDSRTASAELADIDRLLARSQRALRDFNDLATDRGRERLRLSDPAYDASGRLAAWLDAIDAVRDWPAVLACAVALDAWLALEPSEHQAALGFPLAATMLRQRGRARAHLPALAFGLRRGKFRWRATDARPERLAGLVAAIERAAIDGAADLDKLTLARAAMAQRASDRQKNSRLGDLIDLFIASPLVTTALAAKTLAVSPQAIDAMLKQLDGAIPRELTGRRRYRAWGIV